MYKSSICFVESIIFIIKTLLIHLCIKKIITANIDMEYRNVHYSYSMNLDSPKSVCIDDSYSGNRTLRTPPLLSDDSMQKSFGSLDDHSWDTFNDATEQTHASPIFTRCDIPTHSSIHNEDSFSEVNSEDIYVWQDSSDQSTLHRSESCPEHPNWSTSDVTSNEELFDIEDMIIQDILSRKIRSLKLREFLRLLLDNECYSSYASWLNKNEGLFKIHKSIEVANLWRRIKSRKTTGSLNYDTFARGIRSYYKPGIMHKTHTKHTYRFAHV